jgi:predicted ester cyclase
MSAEENKAIVRRYVEEVWTRRNIEALEEFYPSPDLVEQEDPARQGLPSLDDAKEYVRQVQAAFPDLSVTIEDIIAEEDRVAVRTTWRGTYEGEAIGGVAPTGESVTLFGTVIWGITDGKIVQVFGTSPDSELDRLGLTEFLMSQGETFWKKPFYK